MPIKPENKKRYPSNWKNHIRPEILKRANNCCEGSPDSPDCRVENYSYQSASGAKVILTIAHLDHTPENCDGMESGGPALPIQESNLRAWCQRCHLVYDKEQHAQTAYQTRRSGRVIEDLFCESNINE